MLRVLMLRVAVAMGEVVGVFAVAVASATATASHRKIGCTASCRRCTLGNRPNCCRRCNSSQSSNCCTHTWDLPDSMCSCPRSPSYRSRCSRCLTRNRQTPSPDRRRRTHHLRHTYLRRRGFLRRYCHTARRRASPSRAAASRPPIWRGAATNCWWPPARWQAMACLLVPDWEMPGRTTASAAARLAQGRGRAAGPEV